MNRTLYYYNAFITYNNQTTNLHLSDLLDNIRGVAVERRLKRLKQGNICLMNMSDPRLNSNDENDRKVVIGKFRLDKPFISTLGTDRIDEIPDDVVELTSIFYQRNNRLLVVEYNHHGMRPNGLQYYLNSFLPKDNGGRWAVTLEPIEPRLGFNDIAQSQDIKNVLFKIDLTARNQQILNEQNQVNEHRSVVGDILGNSIQAHREFGANFATVGFSNGRKWRTNAINPEQLIPLLRALNTESDVFESIKIDYISPTTGNKETLDLKNQGVLKNIIEVDDDGWETICDSIEGNFYNRGRLGQNNHLEYDIELHIDLPDLIYSEIV